MSHDKSYEHTYKGLPKGKANDGVLKKEEKKPTEAQTGMPYDELGGKYGSHSPERKTDERPLEGMRIKYKPFHGSYEVHLFSSSSSSSSSSPPSPLLPAFTHQDVSGDGDQLDRHNQTGLIKKQDKAEVHDVLMGDENKRSMPYVD
jgi:hypothetical protein